MTTAPAQACDRRAHVIDAATDLFWRHGYDGVSIGDIVEATGMNRYALYQAFGGKKDIFMAALKDYVEQSAQLIQEFLERPDSDPMDTVRDAIVAKMLDPEMFPAGCLICTTAVDVAAKDEDVAAMMAEGNEKIGGLFAAAYARAQEDGRAARQMTPEAFSEMACAFYFSTGMQARMGRSREELLTALESVIDGLRYRPNAVPS